MKRVWKKTISMLMAWGMLLSVGTAVSAADSGRLISPSKNAASSKSEKKSAVSKAESPAVTPDTFIAPMEDYKITQAQIDAVKAIYPQAIYSVPGDNHDNTRDDKRTGLDFRLRKRLPFEFFDEEVENILRGNQGFCRTGEMCFIIEGKILAETEAQREMINHLYIFDTWTIDWFDAHDTPYMHLDTRRRSLDLIHPPKSACHWVTVVDDAVDKGAHPNGNHVSRSKDYTPDVHRVGNSSSLDVDPDGSCAMPDCAFILLDPPNW